VLLGASVRSFAERLYAELFDVEATDSVHLADWPLGEPERRNVELEASMAVARRLTSLGRARAPKRA